MLDRKLLLRYDAQRRIYKRKGDVKNAVQHKYHPYSRNRYACIPLRLDLIQSKATLLDNFLR